MSDFEAAYARYWPLAVVVAGRVLRHPQAAEDAAADAMIRVWRNWGHVTDARSYIVTAARLEAIERGRRPMRRRPTRIESLDLMPERAAPDDPARTAEHAETLREAGGLLGQLRPLFRTALWLFRVEGRTYAEIAAVIGTTTETVKTILVRARRELDRVRAGLPARRSRQTNPAISDAQRAQWREKYRAARRRKKQRETTDDDQRPRPRAAREGEK